jgi:hypothetical protein
MRFGVKPSYSTVTWLLPSGRRALRLECDEHAAAVGVEAHARRRVADLADRLADDRRDVDVRVGRHLAGDVDIAGLHQRLARDATAWILRDDRIEDRITDFVANLVGVTFGHGLAGEQAAGHGFYLSGDGTRRSLAQRMGVAASGGSPCSARSGELEGHRERS